jgi:hypothetical protein
MPAVMLDDNEWGQVMALLANASWRDANPLIMKIGNQLRMQHEIKYPNQPKPDGDGQEVHHE